MHEIAIVQSVVELVTQRCGGRKVVRVVLEIGKLSTVVPDAVRFAFDVVAQSTAADGARLEIVETPGLARCRACDRRFELDCALGECRCGGTDLEWLAGEELRIREMEVA